MKKTVHHPTKKKQTLTTILTPTRTIAITTLFIITLAALAKYANWQLPLLASITLLLTPNKHAEKTLHALTKSLNKKILITALIDATYWLTIFLALFFAQHLAKTFATSAQTTLSTDLLNPISAQQTANTLQTFITQILTTLIPLFILIILAHSISRTYIWTTITDKQPTKKLLLRFTITNTLWWLLWITLFIFIGISKSPHLTTTYSVILLLATYFTYFVHQHNITHQTIKAIPKGLTAAFTTIPQLITPTAHAIIILLIMYQPFKLLTGTIYLQPASMLFTILYLSWLRLFYYNTLTPTNQ